MMRPAQQLLRSRTISRSQSEGLPPTPRTPSKAVPQRRRQARQARQVPPKPLQQNDGAMAPMDKRGATGSGKLQGPGWVMSLGRQAAGQPGRVASSLKAGAGSAAQGQPSTMTILTYNLWFAEDVALRERMQGLVSIINDTQPDVLMFQEVTPNMLQLWQAEHRPLLQTYIFSQPPPTESYFTMLAYKTKRVRPLQRLQRVPFKGSVMGRDMTVIPLSVVGHPSAPPLLVATSHLESPLGSNHQNLEPRERQLEEGCQELTDRAAKAAEGLPWRGVDIVWGGDMNWIPDHKSEPQLPKRWQDVWATHRPDEQGATYDPQTNAMLKGVRYKPGRLDRFFARLHRWQVESIQLVGTQPLPGVQSGRYKQVLISDHYGVLLKLQWPGGAAMEAT